MLEQNVMIGMKVVAHAKTIPGYTANKQLGISMNVIEKVNKSKYGIRCEGAVYNLNGNFYLASDFEPVELTKPGEKEIWRNKATEDISCDINPCAEIVLPINRTGTVARNVTR